MQEALDLSFERLLVMVKCGWLSAPEYWLRPSAKNKNRGRMDFPRVDCSTGTPRFGVYYSIQSEYFIYLSLFEADSCHLILLLGDRISSSPSG